MWKVHKFKYVEEIHLHCILLTKVDYMTSSNWFISMNGKCCHYFNNHSYPRSAGINWHIWPLNS